MDGYKVYFLAVLVVLSAGSTTALNIEVKVPPEVKASVYDVNYGNSTSLVHSMNFTLENPASVGCSYAVRGRFDKGGSIDTVYSKAYDTWPGTAQFVELDYIPQNYTGTVEADIDLFYCDKSENITDYSFESTEYNWPDKEINSKTLIATDRQAKIETSFQNGKLVTIKSPPNWRTGSAKLVNGSATIDYKAPIFRQDRNITYGLIDESGRMVGKTEVSLKNPEPTLKQKILQKKDLILAGLFIASLIGNLYLLRRKIVPEEVRERVNEIEFSDRDLKK